MSEHEELVGRMVPAIYGPGDEPALAAAAVAEQYAAEQVAKALEGVAEKIAANKVGFLTDAEVTYGLHVALCIVREAIPEEKGDGRG